MYWHKVSMCSLSFLSLVYLYQVCSLFPSAVYLCLIYFFLDHSCKRFDLRDIRRPRIFRNSTKSIDVLNHWCFLWWIYFSPQIFNRSPSLLLYNVPKLQIQQPVTFWFVLFLLFFSFFLLYLCLHFLT